MTKTEQMIKMLEEDGHTEIIPSKSRKYRQFTSKTVGKFYWIGKNAAVRFGANSSTSFSITDKMSKRLEERKTN